MTDPAAVVAALLAAGVRRAVLCPGSRNAPLLFALREALDCTVHVDERGAGFLALGMAKATGTPVAVCVTSGTAAANLLPAACEAWHARIPLVLITADRPEHLQGRGAPQTMQQLGLFGGFAPTVGLERLAVPRPGPVHLNIPIADPGDPPATSERPARSGLEASVGRALIVAGSDPVEAASLATATGYPVLCDALSGLRRPAVPGCIASLDALVEAGLGDPDLIIRLGPPPLTRAAWEWLARQRCPQLLVGGHGDWLGTATEQLAAPVDTSRLPTVDGAWRSAWLRAESRAQAARIRALERQSWGAPVAVDLVVNQVGFPLLWLASSMSVRHANLHLAPRAQSQRILCNRGLNGIDGTLASFLGACRATGERGLCLIGDLAALHDINSLSAAAGVEGTIVVLDDGGGGIFDFLPVAGRPGYRELVRADHGLDLGAIAAAFGLPLTRCRDRAGLAAALKAAIGGLHLIVCELRGIDAVAQHRAVLTEMRGVSA